MVKLSFDCIESIEYGIIIEHSFINRFGVDQYFKFKKLNENIVNFYKEKLTKKKDVLNFCCQNSNLKTIKLVVKKYGVVVTNHSLFYACKRGSKKIVKYILSKINENVHLNDCICENFKITKLIVLKLKDKIEIDDLCYIYAKDKKIFKLLVNTYKKLPIDINFIYTVIKENDKNTMLWVIQNLYRYELYEFEDIIFKYAIKYNYKDVLKNYINKFKGIYE